MTWNDSINYILFTNPLVTSTAGAVKNSASYIGSTIASYCSTKPEHVVKFIEMAPQPLWKLAGTSSVFVRLAGLCGASAVVLGAYGAHLETRLPSVHTAPWLSSLHTLLIRYPDWFEDVNTKEGNEASMKVFETANKYHFIHSLALLCVPLCRFPRTSGVLLLLGMSMFCGTCYYNALTGDNSLRKVTPIGGTCLIFGWLAMVL